MTTRAHDRILVIDDNAAIHADLRKILCPVEEDSDGELCDLRAALFADVGTQPRAPARRCWDLEFASQGLDGVDTAARARAEGRPFAIAFVDMRMPPGIDGVETIERLWRDDPAIQVVLCTAFSDRSYVEIRTRLGDSDRLLILKKPFDPAEIQQMASALGEKWHLSLELALRLSDLEARVAEKTGSLAAANDRLATQLDTLEAKNRELEAANERASAAMRAKTDFLTNMSHEIRTPMTAILGFAESLEDPSLSRDEALQHVLTIRRNGEHLLTLINDILDLSKIEAGALRIEAVPLDLHELLRGVLELLRARADEKGIALELALADGLPRWIACDPLRLRQLFVNLVGNAIKFTNAGGVYVHAGQAGTAGDGRVRLEFRVRDTGIGLSAQEAARLFQPFSQADSSTTRRFGGTGLGLSICRRLADLLEGSIDVVSRPGEGSTFRFDVLAGLLAAGPETARGAAAHTDATSAGFPAGPTPLRGRRILLAEDGRDNQRLMLSILQRAGASVVVAPNGAEALSVASAGCFDLILMDMQMPEVDGYEATRALRQRGWTAPIVALTAHAMTGDRERCLAAGCDDYLTKPIDRARLVETCVRCTAPSLTGSRSASREPA